jgi:hypothetical protein
MNFFLILVISAVLQLFLPWWIVAVVPFVIYLWRPETSQKAFWLSLVSVGLVWLGYATYLHVVSEGAMSDRVAAIFFLPNGLTFLPVVSVLVGLVGAMAGLSGQWLRQAISSQA